MQESGIHNPLGFVFGGDPVVYVLWSKSTSKIQITGMPGADETGGGQFEFQPKYKDELHRSLWRYVCYESNHRREALATSVMTSHFD